MPPRRTTFQLFALEQLGRAVPVTARSMFGGIGISSGGLPFALLDDDVLYFKVDDVTRPDFERLGLGPFRPFGDDGPAMQYYRVAEEILEDVDELRAWAGRALDAARRARARKPRPRRPRGG